MKNKIYTLIASCILIISYLPAQTPWDGNTFPVSFTEYLSKVASGNLDYLTEKYNVDIAEAEIAVQRIFPDPELEFEAGEDYYSLELGYTFELGKRRARVGLARTEAELEALALDWFFQELRAQAADAYLETLLQKELLSVKRSSYEYMAQLASYDSIRFRTGEINEIDAKQSSLESATLLNEVYQQEGEYLASLAELNLYMGSASLQLHEPVGQLEERDRSYDLNALVQSGTANRSDLIAANKSVGLALDNLKLVRAERRPDLGVFVGFERDWHGFIPKRDMLKGGVVIPLKFSNINKGAVRQAQFSVEQTQVNLQAAELQVRTEIMQAYYRYEALGRQVGEFRKGMLDDARKVLDGTVFRYKRGETDILEVLVAQRTYNEVHELYLETLKEHISALVELQKSAGIWDLNI